MENSKFEVIYILRKNLCTVHLLMLSPEDTGNNSWWVNTTAKTDWKNGVSTK
jgi:hypothetical protein